LRTAAIQYLVRPIDDFGGFAAQVTGMIEAAASYGSRLIVFPEYLTLQLLTVDAIARPIAEQVRGLARFVPQYVELFEGLARRHGVFVVAGTIPTVGAHEGSVFNDCFVFGPNGEHRVQGKLHMTRFERDDWGITARDKLTVFETDFGRLGVAICYDVEFPEIVRAAARAGADILAVPSCTDDRQGYLRVRYCAHARAIENQMYVVHACTVGSLPMIPAVSMNYGQASILTPNDFAFARDGILAEGNANQEMVVIGDLDMDRIRDTRTSGTVLPLLDSQRSAELVRSVQVTPL
jgi:predicted amidohydrolase